jgi:60S ribosome subunit biogenesis protein NIP7
MVFEKLYKFIGKDIKSMMERPEGHYCLRLHKNRVYYVSEGLMKRATNVSGLLGVFVVWEVQHCGWMVCAGRAVAESTLTRCAPCLQQHNTNQIARDKLVSLGTGIGKLTHSGKFKLTIGALDVLSRYAKHKVRGQRRLCVVSWGGAAAGPC